MPSTETEPKYLEPVLGVVFDLDGTLVLSRHDFLRMRREIIRLAEKSGVTPGHLSTELLIPQILDQARSEIKGATGSEGRVYRFDAEVNGLIDKIELEALPRTIARDGAASLLQGLTDRGFRIGLLTRSSEKFCRAALLRTGLAPFFPYLRTRSSSGPAKPSPEALLLLLKEMAVPVERALFIGDHVLDAECSARARVRFYGVMPDPGEKSSMSVDRFKAAGATAIAENLADLGRILNVVPAAVRAA